MGGVECACRYVHVDLSLLVVLHVNKCCLLFSVLPTCPGKSSTIIFSYFYLFIFFVHGPKNTYKETSAKNVIITSVHSLAE